MTRKIRDLRTHRDKIKNMVSSDPIEIEQYYDVFVINKLNECVWFLIDDIKNDPMIIKLQRI